MRKLKRCSLSKSGDSYKAAFSASDKMVNCLLLARIMRNHMA
ncbi:hypothetical protein LDG_7517 [Legionella drancourtii LLAP12]|uniref:Uncharacterized protein n=1 Tax=Legionella drancourtii LLAP12 TaxID=658187 RepID=G9EQH0_9GAMM|nr:hypothetical protein LDG_7517 [Legionella drancourtii LLAP12]